MIYIHRSRIMKNIFMTYLKMHIWLLWPYIRCCTFNFRNNKFKLYEFSVFATLSRFVEFLCVLNHHGTINLNENNDSIDIVCLFSFPSNFEFLPVLWISKRRKSKSFCCYAIKTMGIIKILLRLLIAPL